MEDVEEEGDDENKEMEGGFQQEEKEVWLLRR